MLNLAAAKVFLCVEPTDMRKSYDTLALLVRDHLGGDPLSASWFVFPGSSAYAVSKAAVWSMSNALRQELTGQGTKVTSVHLGAADTDMMKGYDVPKMDPADVARITLDGVEADAFEVVVDEFTAMVKASLGKDPRDFDKQFQQFLNS